MTPYFKIFYYWYAKNKNNNKEITTTIINNKYEVLEKAISLQEKSFDVFLKAFTEKRKKKK